MRIFFKVMEDWKQFKTQGRNAATRSLRIVPRAGGPILG